MNKKLQNEIREFIGDDPAYVATADAETRIAAMLWAAAWIVEVTE